MLAAASGVLVLTSSAPAFGEYPVLGPGLHQRDWVTAGEVGELEGTHVVMPDGDLLLSVEVSRGKFQLRKLPPAETRMTGGVPFGPPAQYDDLERRGTGLYASQVYDTEKSFDRLLELDPVTGTVRREVFRWPFAFDVIVDPVTKGFVLFDCSAEEDCFNGDRGGSVDDRSDEKRLVIVDPGSGRKTVLVPQLDQAVTGLTPLSLSADGSMIFVGRKESGIDVYDRASGLLKQRIPTSALVVRTADISAKGCFGGLLLYGMHDGSIWSVDPSVPGAPSTLVAAAGQGLQYAGYDLEFDGAGRLIASYGNLVHAEVTIIDCTPIPRPGPPAGQPPGNARPPAGPAQRPVTGPAPQAEVAPPGPPAAPPGGAAPPPGAAVAPQPATAPQPVTQAAPVNAFGQVAQTVGAPQAAMADQHDDVPQLGFSASSRSPHATPLPTLAAALLLAAATASVVRSRSADLALHRGDVR